MKRKIMILVFTFFISLIVIMFFNYYKSISNITNKDHLYQKVEQFLISSEETQSNLVKPKVFTDITKLGIRKKGNEVYDVYVWAIIESYYIENGNRNLYQKSSVPYKFVIKNDRIINYKIPKDGAGYSKSIKEIFPIDIRAKINNILVNSTEIENKVKRYYSYLDNINSNNVKTIDIGKAWNSENEKVKKITLNRKETYLMLDILNNLNFSNNICLGLSNYYIQVNTKESSYKFGLEMYDNNYHITTSINNQSVEAILPNEFQSDIDRIINTNFSE